MVLTYSNHGHVEISEQFGSWQHNPAKRQRSSCLSPAMRPYRVAGVTKKGMQLVAGDGVFSEQK